MKGSILLPLLQILSIILISALLCAGTWLYWFDGSYGPGASMTFETFISRIPGLLLYIYPLTVLISIIISLIRTKKSSGNRLFTTIFILITASTVYYTGYTGLYMLNTISEPRAIESGSHLYTTGKINPLESSRLYIKEKDGKLTVVEALSDREPPSFKVYRNVRIMPGESSLLTENDSIISVKPTNPYYEHTFKKPYLLETLTEDLKIFNSAIKGVFEKSRLFFLLTVISHVAFALACWTIIRLSRWPFLNSLLAIAVIRIFPAYYRLSYSELTRKAIGFLDRPSAPDLAPIAILFTAALILFLWDLLFISDKNQNKSGRNE